MLPPQVQVNDRVEVTQTVERRDGNWETTVCGTVVKLEEQPTGAWFAHGADGKLWLGRLQLRKEDGELTTLILDRGTRIKIL